VADRKAAEARELAAEADEARRRALDERALAQEHAARADDVDPDR